MNTKQKGAAAEAKVKADLLSRGFGVAVPEGDYLPFDLIAIDNELNFYKIQVKSHKVKKNGVAMLKLRRTRYKGGKYINSKLYDEKDVDVFALYIPDVDKCFYIAAEETRDKICGLSLRVESAKGSQVGRKNLRMVEEYEKFPPIVQRPRTGGL